MTRRVFLPCLLTLTTLWAVGSMGQIPQPANTTVFFADNAAVNTAKTLVGRGISLPEGLSTAASKDEHGNEIVWRQVRDETDPRGARHLFYRQDFISGTTVAELHGSEVGLHFNRSGKLWTVAGHQFTAASPANRVTFSAAEAVDRVIARLQRHPTFRAEPAGHITVDQRTWRTANTRLALVSTGASKFRYVWFTFANDVHGEEHGVIIDAETEEILSVSSMHPRSNCHPTTPWQSVSATGEPVRPDLRDAGVRRSLLANVTNDRPSPFTHEGFYQTSPLTSITQETDIQDFQCDPNATLAYTLFPLQTDGGTPTYRNRGDEWQGYAAGDALYHTIETMAAFSTLGRNGWDGAGGDANVVLQSTYIGSTVRDTAFFRMSGSGDARVPPTPFLGITPSRDFHNSAASLDVIAHEWGHGVIYTSANFPYSNTVGAQLHEGFADVIGTAVEKLRQPAGTEPEQSSDWTIHEDQGSDGYARGALDDNTGHEWVRLDGTARVFNDFVHRQDIDPFTDPAGDGAQQEHARGNMLHMVLRLLTEGGENPICSRHPNYEGCGTTSSSLGFTKASQILFDTVAYYAPSTAQWADLATYASAAAFDRYSNCEAFPKKHALVEQSAVDANFRKIGYPRLTDAYSCAP